MKVYNNLRSYKRYLVVIQAVIAVKPYFIAPNTRDIHWEKWNFERRHKSKFEGCDVNILQWKCPLIAQLSITKNCSSFQLIVYLG